MKRILLYILLFLLVIALVFGIFYLVITLKTPEPKEIIEDVIAELEIEKPTEPKLNNREDGTTTPDPDMILFEGEGYTIEYLDYMEVVDQGLAVDGELVIQIITETVSYSSDKGEFDVVVTEDDFYVGLNNIGDVDDDTFEDITDSITIL